MNQYRDPALYAGEVQCPRCGSNDEGYNFPICASRDENGENYDHALTCAKYVYSDLVCPPCKVIMDAQFAGERRLEALFTDNDIDKELRLNLTA